MLARLLFNAILDTAFIMNIVIRARTVSLLFPAGEAYGNVTAATGVLAPRIRCSFTETDMEGNELIIEHSCSAHLKQSVPSLLLSLIAVLAIRKESSRLRSRYRHPGKYVVVLY